ncbi:caspase family protein [Bradyrhizobium barranii]
MNNALRSFWRGGGSIKNVDRLVFYFGGHGSGDGTNGYLVTHDFKPEEPLFTSFLMSDIVGRHFEYVAAHHFLVALDSCSAGLAVPGSRSLAADSQPVNLAEFRKLAMIRADTLPKARNLIVAGTGDQRALWDTGGVFTKALIDGLRGAADSNKDGLVQYDELTWYIRQRVIPEAAMKGVKQEPKEWRATYFGEGKVLFINPSVAGN